jgi:CheY-like chemotaxis protein
MSIPRRLLLADDDAEVRFGVAELLAGLGLEFLHAETGLEAIELARTELLHAALLDVHMPGCTGFEALPLLRRERADLPCILYSGRWTAELERAVLGAGALALLKKPVEPELLRDVVRRALALPMRGPAGGGPAPGGPGGGPWAPPSGPAHRN